MKRLLLAALATLAAGAISCGPFCRSNSDCQTGEHCDFTTSACKLGCTTDEQCGGPHGGRKCDTSTGRCRGLQLPIPFPPTDASSEPDVRTSSTSTRTGDAGVGRG